jgi:CheY-like chemotaxis protein
MTFQALLVSTDDANVAALTPVLAGFGIEVRCCDTATAIGELTSQKFDAVVVDFDDAQRATLVLQNIQLASARNAPVSVALLADPTRVREVFDAGANFVLFKPVSPFHAEASLRAAVSLIRRERRRSLRVPVQVSVELRVANGLDIEGILLDLSEDGMEVLSSQPLLPSASLSLDFVLPGGGLQVQAQGTAVWASPNGQAGVRFIDLSDAMRSSLRDWVASHARRYTSDEAEIETSCQLTDLSQGGCYVQTTSPFPERSGVILQFKAKDVEVHAEGMVRVVHPGFGMGVEFASYAAQQQQELANFIRMLSTDSGASPRLVVTPRALADMSATNGQESHRAQELWDPLLELVRSHASFSQEEFLQELQRQRQSAATSPA